MKKLQRNDRVRMKTTSPYDPYAQARAIVTHFPGEKGYENADREEVWIEFLDPPFQGRGCWAHYTQIVKE